MKSGLHATARSSACGFAELLGATHAGLRAARGRTRKRGSFAHKETGRKQNKERESHKPFEQQDASHVWVRISAPNCLAMQVVRLWSGDPTRLSGANSYPVRTTLLAQRDNLGPVEDLIAVIAA